MRLVFMPMFWLMCKGQLLFDQVRPRRAEGTGTLAHLCKRQMSRIAERLSRMAF